VNCCRSGDIDDNETNDDESTDDYCTSPMSPLGRRDRAFLSASDDSLASTVTDVSRSICHICFPLIKIFTHRMVCFVLFYVVVSAYMKRIRNTVGHAEVLECFKKWYRLRRKASRHPSPDD